ncbi:hypothetical protein ACJJTC_000921 [Scirpophaga incertulas]
MIQDKSAMCCFLLCVGQITSLVELRQNIIHSTESVFQNTINSLLSILRVKNTYEMIPKFMIQNHNVLKEIANIIKLNKSELNNEKKMIMVELNDLLDEQVDVKLNTSVASNVNDYIYILISKLDSLKKEYDVTRTMLPINKNIYGILSVDSKNDNITAQESKKVNDSDLYFSDSEYWKQEQSFRRIYRGERTKIKYFPFMASVHIFNRFFCAGAIIKSDLVVTAASCLQLAHNNRFFRENPAFLSVRVGTKHIIGGESIPVLEVYFYPAYNPKNLHNNICVLRLLRKINLKEKRVKKIAIDRDDSSLSLYTEGITILGWGARKMNNVVPNPIQNILSFAVIDVYPLEECQEIYSKEYVTKKNFCAGFFSKGGGACNHDVGGPGVLNDVLLGIVSFGAPTCGTRDAPTVFTKIAYYADWIDNIMNQYVPVRIMETTLRPTPYILRPTATTSFSMELINGESSDLINESNALRTLSTSELLQQLLSTVFQNGDSDEHEDQLQTRELQTIKQNNTKSKSNVARIRKSTIVPFTKMYNNALTSMGDVDPADENTDEFKYSYESKNSDTKMATETTKNIYNLEKDLVNIIDNKDLKKIIDNMSSLEEEKLLENTKILDLLKNGHVEDKIKNSNESVLTLLYFSESERKKGTLKKLGAFNKESDDSDSEGLSIAVDSNQDLVHTSQKYQ